MRTATLTVFILLGALGLSAVELNEITHIYVEGNNVAASYVRGKLKKTYKCLELATKKSEADGVLRLDSSRESKTVGLVSMDSSSASGTLESLDGEYLWDYSHTITGGVQGAAEMVLRRLAKDCQCKERMKRK